MSADTVLREVAADGAPAVAVDLPAAAVSAVDDRRGWSLLRSPWPLLPDREAVGLRRDLARPFVAPSAGMPLNVLEIDGGELEALLTETGERRNATAAMACRLRRRLARRRIGRCFVVLASGARPCFVQFLLAHGDNPALRRTFGDTFPHLMHDEALLEGAFVPAGFSLERIVPAAMARVAAKAESQGSRWVHSFVPVDDTALLRATMAAGFAIQQWRRQSRLPWRRRTSFGPVPEDVNLRLG